MARDWRNIPRAEQVMIYTVGMLDDMVSSGILVGGKYRLTEESRKSFQEMGEEGFTATKEEIWGAMAALQVA